MKKDINEVEEMDLMEVEEAEESKFKGLASKVGTGIKKHGKKVAVIAAAGAVGLIGYALGSKNRDGEAFACDEIDDTELLELMDSEVAEEE